MYLLIVSDFQWNWHILTKFSKISQHQISWQFVEWFLSCFMHKNGQSTFNTSLTGLSMCLIRTGKEWTPDSYLATKQKSMLLWRRKPLILQTYFRLTTDYDRLTKSVWNIQIEYLNQRYNLAASVALGKSAHDL